MNFTPSQNLNQNYPKNPPPLPSWKDKISLQFWSKMLQNWSIAQKIGYGYALAIGIAVLGGTIGLLLGDYYYKKAQNNLQRAEQQQQYLNTLENAVLNVRSHPQQLIRVLEDVVWFEYETSEFLNNIENLRESLTELAEFVESHPDNIAVTPQEFLTLQKSYLDVINVYELKIQQLWEDLDPLNLKPEDIPAAHQQVIEMLSGQEASDMSLQFEKLSEDLLRIQQAAQKQKEKAIAGQQYADQLRLGIIISSLGVAVFMATILAWRTSRAIARPLQTVTKVAQTVTKDSDFKLQAPITTKDEVGVLANSLNQLIEWVGEYTHKLEKSQETLEQRVEERTVELQQTLQDLRQTQTQLIQTEKMSSLGQMVAGVAHEINNPVSFIHGNVIHIERYVQELFEIVDLYEKQSPTITPEMEKCLEEIDLEFMRSDLPNLVKSMKMGSDRIKTIVLSLRNFSRLDESDMKEVDIHEGIDNTLVLLNNRLKQGVEVVKNYGNLPLISCYPAQLNQVFMNIINNGLDALLETENDHKRLLITTQLELNDQVYIKIKDN